VRFFFVCSIQEPHAESYNFLGHKYMILTMHNAHMQLFSSCISVTE
jgi:hypothetical protein